MLFGKGCRWDFIQEEFMISETVLKVAPEVMSKA
jgi:hypothetical protein